MDEALDTRARCRVKQRAGCVDIDRSALSVAVGTKAHPAGSVYDRSLTGDCARRQRGIAQVADTPLDRRISGFDHWLAANQPPNRIPGRCQSPRDVAAQETTGPGHEDRPVPG
jgi:hypothetical protein